MKNKVIIVGPKSDGGISKVITNLYDGGINTENNVLFYASSFDVSLFGILRVLHSLIEIFKKVTDGVNQEFSKTYAPLVKHQEFINTLTFGRNCIIITKLSFFN